MILSGKGIGDQNGRGGGDQQLRQAHGPGPANGKVGPLQQGSYISTERKGPVAGMAGDPGFRILSFAAAGQMHNPGPRLQPSWGTGGHHAVEAPRPLAAPHDHNEGIPVGNGEVGRERLGRVELGPHWRAHHLGGHPWQMLCRLRHAQRHHLTKSPQPTGHFARDPIGLVQQHRHPQRTGGQNGRSGNVPTGGQDNIKPSRHKESAHL